jgi:hypothetical protein
MYNDSLRSKFNISCVCFREHEKKENGRDNKRSFSGDYEEDEDLDRKTKDQEHKQPIVQKDPFDDTPDKDGKDERVAHPR